MTEQMIQELQRFLKRYLNTFLNQIGPQVKDRFRQRDAAICADISIDIAKSGELSGVINKFIMPIVKEINYLFNKDHAQKLLNEYFKRKSISHDSEDAKALTLISQKIIMQHINYDIKFYFFCGFEKEILEAYASFGEHTFKEYIYNSKTIVGHIAQGKSYSVMSEQESSGFKDRISAIWQSIFDELTKFFHKEIIGQAFTIKLDRTISLYSYKAFLNMIKQDFFDIFLKENSQELIEFFKSAAIDIYTLLKTDQMDIVINTYLIPNIERLSKKAIEQLRFAFINDVATHLSYEQKQTLAKEIGSFESEAYNYLYTRAARLFIKHLLLPEVLRQEQGALPRPAAVADGVEGTYMTYFHPYLKGGSYQQHVDIGHDISPLDAAIAGDYTDAELQKEVKEYVSPEEYPSGFNVYVKRTIGRNLESVVIRGEASVIPYEQSMASCSVLSTSIPSLFRNASVSVPSSSTPVVTQSSTSTAMYAETRSESSDESLSDESEALIDGSSSSDATVKVSGFGSLYSSQSLLPSVADFPDLAVVLESTKTAAQENEQTSNMTKQSLALPASSEAGSSMTVSAALDPSLPSPGFI